MENLIEHVLLYNKKNSLFIKGLFYGITTFEINDCCIGGICGASCG